MESLADYVAKHTERNACRCGKCCIKGEDKMLTGHTVNMVFFDVCAKGDPTAENLRALVEQHRGEWGECRPLDGKEHNYIELGAWVGDQGLGLQLMGLGSLLGLWKLLTPYTMLGTNTPPDLANMMAERGMVAIQA